MTAPRIKIENKLISLWPEKVLRALERLTKDIYKRLNTNVFKRVIDVYKLVKACDTINNQKFLKNYGVVPKGELGIYLSWQQV